MTFKTLLSDINNVALAMESLKNITQFNTGSTIANGKELSDTAIKQYKASIDGLNLSQAQAALSATALNDAQKQQILTSAGLLKNTQAITLEEVKQMASSAALSTQKKEEILATLVEQEEYERLQKTNDELERNLKIEREKAQLNAINGAKTADETVNKKVQSNYVRGDVDSYEGVVLHDQLLNVTPKEELEGAITEYNRLQGEIDKLNKSYDNGSISSEDYTTRLNGLTKAQTTARTRASEMSDILIECEQSYNNLENTGGKFTTTSKQNYDSVKLANQEYASFLDIVNGINDSLNNRQSYEDTINRFKSSEESNLDELTQKYDEAIAKRKELYSGENYVGNVDINNRPVVINDDGSYSTTSTAFQEKWVGDEENGHYIIAHFTPILPDGTTM